MNRITLVAKMLAVADEINTHSGWGALHIFIADGNCCREDLEFCLEQPDITEREREFVERMLHDMSEEALHGAWALAQEPT